MDRTNSPGADPKTDETDKTEHVSNEEFLKAVFGMTQENARPVIVSFPGKPARVLKSAWMGSTWHASADTDKLLPGGANNYFSLSVFHPDSSGQYRRQKAHFQALRAVMLDDIGTKVARERLTLPPSWLLETSQGNFQVGYLLQEPLTDGEIADRLMNAIVTAGLCDPGANGPRTRLARLPVGANGKHEPPFPCNLVCWFPERRYTVQRLIEGLQLDIPPTGRPKAEGTEGAPGPFVDGESVWIPGPESNAVLTALHARGLYKAPLGEGKHDVTCPWVHEHTDAVDGGSAYFEPDDTWPIGGFKCLHGHCASRHIRDLLGVLGVEAGAARMKPTIRTVPGEIHRVADSAESVLARHGRYFQRGGQIVTVVTDPGTHETRIQEVSQNALTRALSGAITWERFDGRSKAWVRIDPPQRHVSVLFDARSYAHLPVLNGLTRQPYLRPDGSLVLDSGYDRATGLFGVFDANKVSVPEFPTRHDAAAALVLLMDLLAEFGFASESDRSAALAAILTAALRPSLSHAPMFHVRAHTAGSGKSYLCELITAFATPQRGTPATFPSDDEECRKLLLAELLRGPAVIEFDNLTGDLLAHKSLCTTLTSEYMSGRILGVSKTATVSTRALFLSSGNNVGPIQDMARRCITIHLDPGVEMPSARSFDRPELVQDVLRARGRYVSAALRIVRAWIVEGRPKVACRPLVSYGEWSDHCRQPLLWLGQPDPTISLYAAVLEDPDRETLGRLLGAWHSEFGRTPTRVRDAVGKASLFQDDHAELREVLHDIAGERGDINRHRLGRWLKRHVGRIVNGLRLVRAQGNTSTERWVVESVSSVLSVISSEGGKTVTAEEYRRASGGE